MPVNVLLCLSGLGEPALWDEGLERMHLSILRHDEIVRLDTTRLEVICDELGYSAGETAICAAMEDIAATLALANSAWKKGDLTALHAAAGEVAGRAESLGMLALARVAKHTGLLCITYNDAALAAVVARMNRLGTGSLLAVWETQDISM